MEFIETALKENDLAVGASRCLQVGAVTVGLFRTRDGFFALNNECPHRGAPLHDGFVSDGKVTCPWHQWDFDLGTGVCRNIPQVAVASYPVQVRAGAIWICPHDQGKPS